MIAYGDESHDAEVEKVFSVAAVIGSEAAWDAFEWRWDVALGFKVFHATDCETGHGLWEGVDKPLRDRDYAAAVRVLAESGLSGYACTMDMRAANAVVPPEARLPDWEYLRLFTRVVAECAKRGLRHSPPAAVRFRFETRGGRFEGTEHVPSSSDRTAAMLFHYFQGRAETETSARFMESLEFVPKSRHGAQAADLIAREAMKELMNMGEEERLRPRRKPLLVLGSARGRFDFDYHVGRAYFEGIQRFTVAQESNPEADVRRSELEEFRLTRGLPFNWETVLAYWRFVDGGRDGGDGGGEPR